MLSTLFSTLFDAIWPRTLGMERRKPATRTADKRAAFIWGEGVTVRADILTAIALLSPTILLKVLRSCSKMKI